MTPEEKAAKWIMPLNLGWDKTLESVLASMQDFKLTQNEVPLVIKLVENPNYKTSNIFMGAVDLFTHDCLHALLGRGLLPKDEAFVIGYTMGSSKKMSRWRRNLFMLICRYFYPEGYRFGREEEYVFNEAVKLGADCPTDLSKVDFKSNGYLNKTLYAIRTELKLDPEVLKNFYAAEKERFPTSAESQRLL